MKIICVDSSAKLPWRGWPSLRDVPDSRHPKQRRRRRRRMHLQPRGRTVGHFRRDGRIQHPFNGMVLVGPPRGGGARGETVSFPGYTKKTGKRTTGRARQDDRQSGYRSIVVSDRSQRLPAGSHGRQRPCHPCDSRWKSRSQVYPGRICVPGDGTVQQLPG